MIQFPGITRAQIMNLLAGKADWTPRVVGVGETLHVPAGEQMLFAEEIAVEGEIVLDGDLIGVG